MRPTLPLLCIIYSVDPRCISPASLQGEPRGSARGRRPQPERAEPGPHPLSKRYSMLDNILNRVRPERKYDPEELKKRLPPGQSLTEKWPVLHYGGVPHTPLDRWTFRVFGLVEEPVVWTYE